MKRLLLGSSALVGVGIAMPAGAQAEEPITWSLGGDLIFHFYYVDQDFESFDTAGGAITQAYYGPDTGAFSQDHDWYFGVDEAELDLDVSGVADNGLNYGFRIEINANTTDDFVADEARLQLSGGWGTLQLGDEDGVEDVMSFGGEDLLGGAGGFDDTRGEYGDVLIRQGAVADELAPSFAVIAGETSDSTKATYYTPRIAGFQAGGSLTPTPNDGDQFKADGDFEDHYALGLNYDSDFGRMRIRGSVVYTGADDNTGLREDLSAWSVGGILGWGPFSLGAGYTDNGDSFELLGSDDETSFWTVGGAYEAGPFKLSAGWFDSTKEFGGGAPDSEYTTLTLTADYTVAAGLGLYGELDLIEDDVGGASLLAEKDNDATVFIAGAQVSF